MGVGAGGFNCARFGRLWGAGAKSDEILPSLELNFGGLMRFPHHAYAAFHHIKGAFCPKSCE
jgi:hypothetical protein